MVWVLSSVVGGGWFWGAEGLGLKGWDFWGFSRMPVVVVPWWWSVVPWCSSWCSHNVVVVPWWWCSFGSGGLSWWWRCPWWWWWWSLVAVVVVPWWWSHGGGRVAVVRGGGLVVVVPWWWSCGGCLVVVVPWWWSRGGGIVVVVRGGWSVVVVRGGGPCGWLCWWSWWWSRGGGLVVVVSWWWSCGGGLVVVVSWGGLWFRIFFSGMQQSDVLNQARLRAFAAPWADGWLCATPSMAADSLLQSEVLRDAVRLRLDMPIFDGGGCAMCTQACDDRGHHCLACMASGHKQLMHNTLRNTVYRYAELAGTRPNLEPIGLLPSDPHFRPADVLIMTTPSIVASSWRQFPRLAFDFAIVSPFLATNLATSASVELSAANSYAKRKFALKDCGKRCEAMNVGYEPIVFEVTGGLALEGQRHLQMICEAIDTK